MTVKQHYDEFLGNLYPWMCGDFDEKKETFSKFLKEHDLEPQINKRAIDLGSGHGIQSISLAENGYVVLAIDFNKQLIEVLQSNAKELPVTTHLGDIRNISSFAERKPELVTCCGDTLSHLDNFTEVKKFFSDVWCSLVSNGKFILSFRDYAFTPATGEKFLLVRSDETKILTCALEYGEESIRVTDILHKKRTINGT